MPGKHHPEAPKPRPPLDSSTASGTDLRFGRMVGSLADMFRLDSDSDLSVLLCVLHQTNY